MILDWSAHCYKIHKTRKLSRDDPSDNKSVFSQEAHYIKFLMLKGLEYKDIYFQWVKIKNGMAAAFRDEPEQQVATFARVYRSSANISEKVFKQHYTPVRVYKSEIKFLNSIKAPIWVRQYWLAMLIYWKFASQHTKNVEIDSTLCNWAMRLTDLQDSYFGHHQDQIAQYNYANGSHVMQSGIMKRNNSRIYWFDWAIGKSDEEFVEIINLDKTKKALKLIIGNMQICPKCGKEFVIGPRQRTNLCPTCYEKERKQMINRNSINYYHNKKCDVIKEK